MARQMKDSGIAWIGEIPENWRTCKIKDVFDVVSGATPKSEQLEYWDGDIVWITPADYKTNDKFITFGKRTITQAGYDSCGTTLIPAGSIVFSKRAPIGSVAIAQVPLCTNQGCLSCINKGEADTTFFYYVMSIFTEIFELYGSGTTFKELSYDSFAAFAMTNPPISEQRRIAAFLDRRCAEIDAVMERTKATIEDYKKLKQTVITEAVTKGVRGPRQMKDSGIEWIGEIPEEWMLQKLKNVTSLITDGTHVTPNYIESGVPFLSIKDISSGRIDFSDAKYISEEEHQLLSKSTPIERGDMLFTRIGTLGVFVFVDTDTVFDIFVSVGLIKFRSSISKANKQFIRYFLLSTCTLNYINLVKAGGGTAAAKFNLTDVRNTVFAVPPSDEQEEIVAYLDEKCSALDTLIARKTALLTELEAYKKSLIYEYVTGKKEVL